MEDDIVYPVGMSVCDYEQGGEVFIDGDRDPQTRRVDDIRIILQTLKEEADYYSGFQFRKS